MSGFINNRKAKIQVLRAAYRHISIHPNDGICAALLYAVGEPELKGTVARSVGEELRLYVMRALEGAVYYDNWLKRNGYHHNALSPHMRRQGRLAWINWMIQCYEEDIAKCKE